MAHVNKTPLAADTLNRKWFCDVNTGTYGSPTWISINGMLDFKASRDNTMQDDSDFDSDGAKSSTATAYSWSATTKLKRAVTVASATAYDAGQEVLRAASLYLGTQNRVDIRFYEVTTSGPVSEAWRGYAAVAWSEDGGGMDALDTVSCTLTGQGALTAITHPDYAAAVPIVYSCTPNTGIATAGGTLVHIVGVNFFLSGVDDIVATTGVALEAHSFSTWNTVDDQNIWGVTPAETAGASTVLVTNSTGVCTVTVDVTVA